MKFNKIIICALIFVIKCNIKCDIDENYKAVLQQNYENKIKIEKIIQNLNYINNVLAKNFHENDKKSKSESIYNKLNNKLKNIFSKSSESFERPDNYNPFI